MSDTEIDETCLDLPEATTATTVMPVRADSHYEIDDGVPIPPATRNRPSNYPWAQLNVGQSFFAPTELKNPSSVALRGSEISGHTYEFRRTTEKGVKGVRFWRVA
jgi:hypothetical protein